VIVLVDDSDQVATEVVPLAAGSLDQVVAVANRVAP
jgi:hypothetical protein